MGHPLRLLPAEPVDRLTRPFAHFLRIEATAGGVLAVFVLLALALANSPWSATYLSIWEVPVGVRIGSLDFSRSLKHWINDGLMTVFFFVVALELKREFTVGELRNPRMAALSFAAALGGMIVPAGLYLLVTRGTESMNGWGTVMATDTAFLIGCLAILGKRVPLSLRLFLLSLAIFDDIGAIMVVAIGYGGPLDAAALGFAALGLGAVLAFSRIGVRSISVYFLIGSVVWIAFDRSGIHPTLTGVILGLMTPARAWVGDLRLQAILQRVSAYPPGEHWSGDTVDRKDLQRARVATREALSPVERLEMSLHPAVAFAVMPLFVAANAGVPISTAAYDGSLMLSIIFALVLGKPLGVVLFSMVAVRLGLASRSPELAWGMIVGGSLLTGIGFTMAIFIAEMAFPAGLLDSAKLGILGASLLAAVCGLAVLYWLSSRDSTGRSEKVPTGGASVGVV